MSDTPLFNMGEPVAPRSKKPYVVAGCIAIVACLGIGVWLALKPNNSGANASKTTQTTTVAATTQSPVTTGTAPTITAQSSTSLTLDTTKNYGDKYANGLLPVGDSKYMTTAAKKGYVYTCNANYVPASQAGAQTRGPWFTNNNTQWDSNKKASVAGSVNWTPNISIVYKDGKRVINTNDLPDHHTGTFPVAANDPAHAYDANPNTIKTQTLSYSLTGAPVAGSPQCMGGEVGVMITGVALFNGFDAGGRDAGAWEVQDTCDGHPQNKGEYHYHTLSRCITDQSVTKVIGYALDGFPITGPKVGTKNILTTNDLDECHGITSAITLDGKKVTMYHYVMTQDFPYSVSCFRATPIKAPGVPETSGSTGAGGTGTGMGGGMGGSTTPPSNGIKKCPPSPLGADGINSNIECPQPAQ